MNQKWIEQARACLGCQVWLEPEETRERVDALFAEAANSGLGWIRIFLMWPWIEEKPGQWKFDVFDYAFDAAEKHGIRIKATLTANSGPWHIGTPSLLHSHTGFLSPDQREPMRRYILQCVNRYKNHPALGQWILWNEPTEGKERTAESLKHWQTWLDDYYEHDIERLNRRWRTGYASFEEVPFPENIMQPQHSGSSWNSYAPWLLEWQSRAAWLNSEVEWIRDIVREADNKTETCVNPIPFLDNQASGGIDINAMGDIVDVVGASYHPAWNFTYADREKFPALMAIGVRKQAANPQVGRVEVTEVQTGNTLVSSHRPCEASPGEIARYFLAGLAAGAETVTGWCLNVRSYDFEAGDWGLLDDMDQQSPRSEMLRRVQERLAYAFQHTGRWRAAQPRAWIGYDPLSQAVEWVEDSFLGSSVPGRLTNDSANGSALLTVSMLECGINPVMARIQDLPIDAGKNGGMIVLSHLVAWENEEAIRTLSFVKSGGTLIIDATCGRKNLDARLHRPWPGGISEKIGMRASELHSLPGGYKVLFEGRQEMGSWITTRIRPTFEIEAGWKPWSELRFELDGQPCVWERTYGQGKIVFVNGLLGPSLIHEPKSDRIAKYIIRRAAQAYMHEVRLILSPYTSYVVPIDTEHGHLTAVFSGSLAERNGQLIYLQAAAGRYLDLWTGEEVVVRESEEIALTAEDGVALLWKA